MAVVSDYGRRTMNVPAESIGSTIENFSESLSLLLDDISRAGTVRPRP